MFALYCERLAKIIVLISAKIQGNFIDYYTDICYNADIVSVPDSIGINIKKHRNQCDKWLFNKLNEHEFWEKDDSGNKLGVGVCSESFIYWLNEFVLKDSKEKAYIVRKSINNYDESLPTIYY